MTADEDFKVRIWRLDDGEFVDTLDGHLEEGRIAAVVPSADGSVIATCGNDRIARLWRR